MTVTLPVVNGSSGTWGGILNTAITDIDNRVTDNTNKLTTLQNTSTGGKFTVATSGTRPNVEVGQVVLETDTGFIYYGASVGGVATRVPMPGMWVAKLRRTTTLNMSSGVSYQMSYTNVDFDRLGGFNSGSAYNITVPGIYEFTGGTSWITNSTGYRSCWLRINNNAYSSSGTIAGPSSDSTSISFRPTVVRLAQGDTVDMTVLQSNTAGTALACDTDPRWHPVLNVKYLGYHA